MKELYNGFNKIKISKTQYEGLGYANTNPVGKACWRVIDMHESNRLAPVGPLYATKDELLSDLPRYAATWGY